jgi:hypothetical protein
MIDCHDCTLAWGDEQVVYCRSCNEPICVECHASHGEKCVVAPVIERAKFALRPIIKALAEQAAYENSLPDHIGRWEEFVDGSGIIQPQLSNDDLIFLDATGILIWEGSHDDQTRHHV